MYDGWPAESPSEPALNVSTTLDGLEPGTDGRWIFENVFPTINLSVDGNVGAPTRILIEDATLRIVYDRTLPTGRASLHDVTSSGMPGQWYLTVNGSSAASLQLRNGPVGAILRSGPHLESEWASPQSPLRSGTIQAAIDPTGDIANLTEWRSALPLWWRTSNFTGSLNQTIQDADGTTIFNESYKAGPYYAGDQPDNIVWTKEGALGVWMSTLAFRDFEHPGPWEIAAYDASAPPTRSS
jgi:hypothetical protein